MRYPFNGTFRLTQSWGVNPQDYAKFGIKGHNGLDYGLPNGTPIVAPHDGKILEAAFDAGGYGNYLKVESATEGSVLAHLQNFVVKVGDTVKEGQLIGYSDNTGNSTGPHLHWGYYKIPRNRQDGYLGYINQLPIVSQPSAPQETPEQEVKRLRAELNDLDRQKKEWESKANDLEKKVQSLQSKIDRAKKELA